MSPAMTARLAGLVEAANEPMPVTGRHVERNAYNLWRQRVIAAQDAVISLAPALLARIAALESALEPFAKEAARIELNGPASYLSDDVEIWQSGPAETRRSQITYGNLRRAALALKENEDVG